MITTSRFLSLLFLQYSKHLGLLSERDFHFWLFFTIFVAVCHVSHLFISIFSAVLFHVSFSHPKFLLPCRVHFKAVNVKNSSIILILWPIYHHLFLSINANTGVTSVSLNKISFLMVFGQNTHLILHRYLVWKAS